LLHGPIGGIADRRNSPAVDRFHQLPGLAAGVGGYAVGLENKIEIDSRDGAIRVDDKVAVFRVERLGRRGDNLRKIVIVADADVLGRRRLSLCAIVCGVSKNVQPEQSGRAVCFALASGRVDRSALGAFGSVLIYAWPAFLARHLTRGE
jgi:hypothetical protein